VAYIIKPAATCRDARAAGGQGRDRRRQPTDGYAARFAALRGGCRHEQLAPTPRRGGGGGGGSGGGSGTPLGRRRTSPGRLPTPIRFRRAPSASSMTMRHALICIIASDAFALGAAYSGARPLRPPLRSRTPSLSIESPSLPQQLWSAYERQLDAQPVLTKACTSLVGFAVGDVIAQTLVEGAEVIDTVRLLKLSSFGCLVHGTTCHFFYQFLDRRVPGTDAVPVASKVAIDQILWNPIFGCMFFAWCAVYEGGGATDALLRIQQSLWTQVSGSWSFWPFAHVINFRFIPTEQRLLYINVLQVRPYTTPLALV
jgi:protein Mpv17